MAMQSGIAVRYGAGPLKGVRFTSEPYDEAPDTLTYLRNGYIPDPISGSAAYSRPGFALAENGSIATRIQGTHTHIALDGTAYNFVVANGVLYREATTFATLTDVTPTGITISGTESVIVYFVSLGDSIIVNDGVSLPWILTNPGSTPVTGTPITYESGLTLLSRGSTDTRVASAAFVYNQGGTQATQTAIAAGTALAAGTVPMDKWAVYRVYRSSGGTVTVSGGSSNFIDGYDSEAEAAGDAPAVPAGGWDMGYFTLKTAVGTTFVGNTDALQGGASGNPASETTYYPASLLAWQAFGQPVIYYGAVFFVLSTVDAVAARTSIAWSEPNLPAVGYRQTDYDNVWELTQTGSDPIFALAATNDALYYSRRLSWGALGGAPNINFQNTATSDVVSGNVGCTAPKSVTTFLNYVYFVDAQGRPYRFAVGGAPEPLWTQLRQWFDEVSAGGGIYAAAPWSVVEPNLNVVCVYLGATTVVSVDQDTALLYDPHVFDAVTGIYLGQWRRGGSSIDNPLLGGLFTDSVGRRRMVWGGSTGELPVLTISTSDQWDDAGSAPVLVEWTGPWMGYTLAEENQFTVARALALGDVLALDPDADQVITATNLAIGTTVTLSVGPSVYAIDGLVRAYPLDGAKAFGALGTIPASQWGVIAVERNLAGTISFTSGSANYTTGYASSALAIAALPAQSANKVQVGYVVVQASASGWVAGTDALAGGTGGNPATTTTYVSTPSATAAGMALALLTPQTSAVYTTVPPQSALTGQPVRYVLSPGSVMGRGAQVRGAFLATDGSEAAQVLLYRMEADAVVSSATPKDR